MSDPSPPSYTATGPSLAKAGGIMVASLFLSRVLGLVRDAVMAGMFGSDITTDAYRLAFSVPDLIFFLIAGGALSSAFIPVFSEYLHTDREPEAWKVFSVVTTFMTLLIGTLVLIAFVFAEPLSHWIAPGKSPEVVPLIATMSRIVLPAQIAFFVGGLLFGTLYARNVFAVPGLGPNVYNLGIIFGAVALSWFVSPGVIGMSWGALLGALIGNLLIPIIAMARLGSHFKPSLELSHPGVKKVFRLMLPVVLGLSLPGVYGLITQWFGSFYPAGVNTWLDYANKLMQAPLGIFGQSLALALFPVLTQFFAQKRMDLYQKQLAAMMRTVIYLTVPISALLAVLAPLIVAAIYQHGKFGPSDTAQVALCLRYFSIGIWAWCLHPVLMRGFFAMQSTVTPVLLGTLTTALFVGLVVVLRATQLGWAALPLASSLSAIVLVVLLVLGVRKQIGGLDVAGLIRTTGKSLAATALVSALAWALLRGAQGAFGTLEKVHSIVFTCAILIASAGAYAFLTRKMGMPESAYVDRAMARFNRNSGPPGEPPSGSHPSEVS